MRWSTSVITLLWAYLYALLVASQKQPVSQDLFDTFKRYAEFSAAAYASDCPNPPSGITIIKQINNAQTNTQGFIARDDSVGEIIMSFRGTSNIQDFQVDLQEDLVPLKTQGVSGCNECMAHEGFLSAWNSIASETITVVRSELSSNPNMKVTVTGHSLGGSLASLAAMSMIGSGVNVTTYTFGQPRTGNQAYADFVDRQAPPGVMFRVTHSNDGVPQVVPVTSGYQHHSTEFWQEDKATAAGTFECTGQEPQDCNNSVRGTGLGAGGIGINAAHLEYMGISSGNPADKGAQACGGKTPGLIGTIGGLLGIDSTR